jgi:hypothetical protein
VVVSDEQTLPASFKRQWKDGEQSFTASDGRVLEKAKGYDTSGGNGKSPYLGSRDNLFFRYHYNFKNIVQWGLLGDKDAGEPFFRGQQRLGFDFYSFHFFAKGEGWLKTLAIGDFTVNMGQGLIQWQTLAFKKSADVLAIKRQSPVLRPYNSTGEYNFHRGIGITLQHKRWETTMMASAKRIDGTPVTDSVNNDDYISAFRTDGYHRTVAENAARHIIRQTALGGNVSYRWNTGSVGINAMQYHFSLPLNRPGEPYNLFAFSGTALSNAGMDYSYTWRNFHFFGEAAADDHFHKAFVQGILLSPDAAVDMSILYRRMDKNYQSLYSNAFTENTTPVNESGLYAGICFRPAYGVQLNAYTDVYRFPWLKYRVDAPGGGRDYLVQLGWTPDKQTELYIRYKAEAKSVNRSDSSTVTAVTDMVPQQDLRLQCNMVLNRQWTMRQRVELCWYDKNGPASEQGFTMYADGIYHPRGGWQGSLRLQYFETDGYNSRIYALENGEEDHLSVPALYGKGVRYYVNSSWNMSKRYKKQRHALRERLALRWAQTIYSGQVSVDSGNDAIAGNRKTELTLQLMLEW